MAKKVITKNAPAAKVKKEKPAVVLPNSPQFDGKNREVLIYKKGAAIYVEKPDTGFKMSSHDHLEAITWLNEQINCTQN